MCDPYDPTPGFLLTDRNWGSHPVANGWVFLKNNQASNASRSVWELKHNNVVASSLIVTPANVIPIWTIFGAGDSFMAVSVPHASNTSVSYSFFVFDLRDATNVPAPVQLNTIGPFTGQNGQFVEFQYSADGLAIYIHIAGVQGFSESRLHGVYRSDNGAAICGQVGSHQAFNAVRRVRIEGGRVEIGTTPAAGGFDVFASCDMPAGKCTVITTSPIFPQAIIGGPQGSNITSKTFTLKNTGTDCIDIVGIADSAPFSVVATSHVLPAELLPGDTITITVQFAPQAVGSFGPIDLPVTCQPIGAGAAISVQGSARAARVQVSVTPNAVSFPVTPLGSSAQHVVTVTNSGEAALENLAWQGSPAGQAMSWNAQQARTLAIGQSVPIQVEFAPQTATDYSASIAIVSDASTSPDVVTIQGAGCFPQPVLSAPLSTPINFEVQQGFRTVRLLDILNNGNGTLTFTATIRDDSNSIFSLLEDGGSIYATDVQRQYILPPTSSCGPGATGLGRLNLVLACWANADPGTYTARLVIEGHNDPIAPPEITYALSVDVSRRQPVDAVLVLDRSGSMADTLGSRTKQAAAIDAAQLFASLMRPDVTDRLAVVAFESKPSVVAQIAAVTSANQAQLVGSIDAASLAPTGGTALAGGVLAAQRELSTPRRVIPADVVTTAIVVLTDGADNTAYLNPADHKYYSLQGGLAFDPDPPGNLVQTEPLQSIPGQQTYGVGLGIEEDLDKAQLELLTEASGGYPTVTGELRGKTYFQLEKFFTQVFMDIADIATISDPHYRIGAGETHRHEFEVLRGDLTVTAVIYDLFGRRLPFELQTPAGEAIRQDQVPAGFQVRVGSSPTARFVDVVLPSGEPERYAGRWTLQFDHGGFFYVVGTAHRDRLWDSEAYEEFSGEIEYGFAIGAGSNLRMRPWLTPGSIQLGEPIELIAELSEAGLPLAGCNLIVEVTAPAGTKHSIALPETATDGTYGSVLPRTSEAGQHLFRFRATGLDRDGTAIQREAIRSKYVRGRVPIVVSDRSGGTPTTKKLDLISQIRRRRWP